MVPFGKIRHFRQMDHESAGRIGRCPPLVREFFTSRGAIKCKSLDDSNHDVPIVNHGGFVRFTHRFFSNLPRLGKCTSKRTASNVIPPIGPRLTLKRTYSFWQTRAIPFFPPRLSTSHSFHGRARFPAIRRLLTVYFGETICFPPCRISNRCIRSLDALVSRNVSFLLLPFPIFIHLHFLYSQHN